MFCCISFYLLDILKGVYVSEDGSGPTDFVVRHSVEALKRKSRFNMDEDYPDSPAMVDISKNYQFVRGEEKKYKA